MNDPRPKTIGIDEHGLFKDKKRGAREFATIFVDYTNKRIKEVVEEKSHAELEKGICHIKQKENVQNVVIDLSDPYKYFVKNYFPNAKIVADKFHVLRLLNPEINRRRIGITEDKRTLGIRRLLLRNGFKLSYFERSAIWRWLDDYPELREESKNQNQSKHQYEWKESGGRDGTRTRGLLRDRQTL